MIYYPYNSILNLSSQSKGQGKTMDILSNSNPIGNFIRNLTKTNDKTYDYSRNRVVKVYKNDVVIVAYNVNSKIDAKRDKKKLYKKYGKNIKIFYSEEI